MRKSTLVLMIVICGLMFYTGCGEDDDGGAGRPAAPGAPAAPSPECQNCPCKYFDIEINKNCYSGRLDAGFSSSLSSNTNQTTGMCLLLVIMEGNTGVTLEVNHSTPTEWRCGYSVPIDDRCGAVETTVTSGNFKSFFLDIDRNTARSSCAPCLSQYAKELEALVPVKDNNRPDVYPHLTCIPRSF